jgi:YfiH family protein
MQAFDRMARDWIVPEWPVPPHVRAFVTTRRGGVSKGAYASLNLGGGGAPPDDPAAIAQNRRLLMRALPQPPVWLHQVHGTEVVAVDAPRDDAPVADAAVTRTRDVPLAVRIADCLPVFFADRAGTAIGVAHAGWRGLAAGVLERTLAALAREPADVVAWIGPGIGADAFEVGDDVHAAFTRGDPGAAAHFQPDRPGKWRADLPALARRRLAARGVPLVLGGAWCTVRDSARFFSYRRDGTTGRMAAVIWLAAPSP